VINDVTVSEPAGASGLPCCPVTNTLTTVTVDATSQQADMDYNGLKGQSDDELAPRSPVGHPVRHRMRHRIV
jgi:hypothetical protein